MKQYGALFAVLLALSGCATVPDRQANSVGGAQTDGESPEVVSAGPSAARYFVDAVRSWDDQERAIELLTEAIEIDESFALAYFERAERYRKVGRYREALADLSAAIEADPGFLQAYRIRYELRSFQMGDESGIEDLERAYAIDPTHLDTALAWASHLAWKEPDQALQIYDSLVGIYPDEYGPLVDRGMYYRDRGAYERALDDFRQALAIGAAPPWVAAQMVQLYLALGRPDSARVAAQELAWRHPDTAEAALATARVVSLGGVTTLATRLYEQYLQNEWIDHTVWLELSVQLAATGDAVGAANAIAQFQMYKSDPDRVRIARLANQILLGERERALGGLEALTGEKDWDVRPWLLRALVEEGEAARRIQSEALMRINESGGVTGVLLSSPELWLFARTYLRTQGSASPAGIRIP